MPLHLGQRRSPWETLVGELGVSHKGLRLPILLVVALSALVGCQTSTDSRKSLWERAAVAVSEQARALSLGVHVSDIAIEDAAAASTFALSMGPLSDKRATEVMAALEAIGVKGYLHDPARRDPRGERLGSLVRVGPFDTARRARAVADGLSDDGFDFAVRNTAEDGRIANGPIRLRVLRLTPASFRGQVKSVLALAEVQGRETVSSMAQRTGATAAINAGFFAWEDRVGVPGDPAGLLVIDGELVSETVAGRPAFVIDSRDGRIRARVVRNVQTRITIDVSGKNVTATGINRSPGKVLNCGYDSLTESARAAHDLVCVRSHELIVFDEHYGALPADEQANEMWVGTDGRITSCREAAGPPQQISPGEQVLRATGMWQQFVREHCDVGKLLSIEKRVTSAEGALPLERGVFAVGGGPTLVHESITGIAHYAVEGWGPAYKTGDDAYTNVDSKDGIGFGDSATGARHAFYHGWVVRRHPRTAVGLTATGDILFVVVDGRQAGYSIGASLADMRQLLMALGAVSAINLDGGGSSAMVIEGGLLGRPSDREGERPVGDAIVIVPEGSRSSRGAEADLP